MTSLGGKCRDLSRTLKGFESELSNLKEEVEKTRELTDKHISRVQDLVHKPSRAVTDYFLKVLKPFEQIRNTMIYGNNRHTAESKELRTILTTIKQFRNITRAVKDAKDEELILSSYKKCQKQLNGVKSLVSRELIDRMRKINELVQQLCINITHKVESGISK